MAQPDFPLLAQALHGLGEQVQLTPNMPGPADVPVCFRVSWLT